MDHHLVADSGGEIVIYFRCGPTAKPTVSQALNTFKLMITQISLFKISESQKNANRHQCGKWNYRVEGD